jgi:inner membrane protein
MASIGHIAIGLAGGRLFLTARARPTSRRLMLLLSAASMAPDLDVIGMRFGVPYGATWGHRGATHSLAMAIAATGALALMVRRTHRPLSPWPFAALALAVIASHGLLDALTDGGRGVALLWPWTDHRFFFPWRPIPVAPIGAGILSPRGLRVMAWEAVVFAPAWLFACWPREASGA